VLLYVREGFGAVFEVGSCGEPLWITIQSKVRRDLYIGVCPTASKEETHDLFINIKKYSKYSTLIMGDFNFSDINWVDMDAVGKEEQEFVKLINDCFLIQHVHSPTR